MRRAVGGALVRIRMVALTMGWRISAPAVMGGAGVTVAVSVVAQAVTAAQAQAALMVAGRAATVAEVPAVVMVAEPAAMEEAAPVVTVAAREATVVVPVLMVPEVVEVTAEQVAVMPVGMAL